jgi:hypothetical protein
MPESLPLFRLYDPRGQFRGSLDCWQRRDMVIALLHSVRCDRCREVQSLFLANEERWRAEEAAVLTVALTEAPAEALWATALVDPAGEVVRNLPSSPLKADQARVLVVNRFAEVYACLDAHGSSAAAVLEEVKEWMDFVQRQCGECQAPWDNGQEEA